MRKVILFVSIISLLICSGAQAENPYTPDLVNAVITGDQKLVAHYLEFGADVNKKIEGETVLMLAIREAAEEAQEFRTTGARLAKDGGLWCVSFVPLGAVNYLPYPDAYFSATCLGIPALLSNFYFFYKLFVSLGRFSEQAFKGRRMGVIKALLADKKIDLKATNAHGQTALDVVHEYMINNSSGGCVLRTMRRIETVLLKNQAVPARVK